MSLNLRSVKLRGCVVSENGFTVRVADNFHYGDEKETYTLGKFATLEEALNQCKSIVDDYLSLNYRDGMSAGELFDQYKMFGEDPYIVEESLFSAWDYAKARIKELADES